MRRKFLLVAHFGGLAAAVLVAGWALALVWQLRADALNAKNDYCVANVVTCQNLDDDANNLLSWSNRLANDNVKTGADIYWNKILSTGDGCGKATGVPCIEDASINTVNFSKFSTLKCTAQSTPDNTVAVASGSYLASDGLSTKTYAGGNSPAFPNGMTSGQERLDVLTIDDSGTLAITAGTAGAPPVSAPDYPADKVPVCEVLLRFGFTQIKDADDTLAGYIKTDARPLLFYGIPITTGKINDGAVTTPKLGVDAAVERQWKARGGGACSATSSAFVTCETFSSITTSDANADVKLDWSGIVRLQPSTGTNICQVRFARDSTGIFTQSYDGSVVGCSAGANCGKGLSMNYLDVAPGAGTYAYKVEVARSSGDGNCSIVTSLGGGVLLHLRK